MSTPEPDLRHHGDADAAPGLVDLAVNVRAGAPPTWLRQRLRAALDSVAAYPDPAAARAAVAARHGRRAEEVLLTAGAAEAFVLLARALAPERAAVVHPQFTEPEAALRAAGRPVHRVLLGPGDGFTLDPAAVPADADLVVVGNPTNPTSVLHPAAALAALCRPGRTVVVDEAFADCVPGEPEGLAGRRDLPGLVVVRSLTKTWGLAGLRAGYVLADAALVARLHAAQPLWAVSTPALAATVACSSREAVAEADRWAHALAADRDHLTAALAALDGVRVVPDARASFLLLQVPGGEAVRRSLREQGFAVRRGDTFPGLGPDWLRVAVRGPATSEAFAAALQRAVAASTGGPSPVPAASGAAAVPAAPPVPVTGAAADPGPYPLGLRLAGRRVLVVGGGAVATRRVPALVDAGADVVLVAPSVGPLVEDLAARGALRWERRGYDDRDVDGAWLVHACTDDPAVNATVAAAAEARRTWCVRADDASAASAWVPARATIDGVTLAVHAGSDPRRAAAVRDDLHDHLRTAGTAGRRRRRAAGVALVGGGPGDPALITMRGRELLAQADVVVTDRLGPLALLDELSPDAEVLYVGKVPRGPAAKQEAINDLLVEHAQAGRFVVRLKGGDPFVFGRGGEEVQACAEAGVAVEVVPGVTSAVAVPALAGIPLTHRSVTQEFTVASGHLPPGHAGSTVDWVSLGRDRGTLVLLMAVENLPAIAAALQRGGRDPSTPVACIEEGSTARQRLLRSTLGAVPAAAEAWGLRPPAIVVVGEVVDALRGSGAVGGPAGAGSGPAADGPAAPRADG